MVDLTFLRKFTKGNEAKMQRYISMYLTEAEKTLDQMQIDLDNQDWESLKVNAHSLKPQAEMMGIKVLKDTLIEIEDASEQGETDKIPELFTTSLTLHEAAALELASFAE